MPGNTASLAGMCRSLRSAIAPAAKTWLLRSGAFEALRGLRPSERLAILRYHAICGPEGYRYASPGICVSPSAFERHVSYLKTHYAVVSLPAALEVLRHRRSLPDNAVAITFDDGYADNLPAARTLHRYGLSATFYITAGCLAGEEPFWPSEIRALVALIRGPAFTLTLNGQQLRFPCAAGADRREAVGRLTVLFKSHPIAVRDSLRQQLRRIAGVGGIRSPMLTWSQVAEMRDLGMTIGAHTMTHPNLPSAGLEDATREIVESKHRLEQKLSIDVTMFSYPNGGAERYYTPQLQQVVRNAGYEGAATSRSGFVGQGSDMYGLERVQVSERLEDLVFALEAERFVSKPGG